MHTPELALANGASYGATSASSVSSPRRSFCKPTANCVKSVDPIDEKKHSPKNRKTVKNVTKNVTKIKTFVNVE